VIMSPANRKFMLTMHIAVSVGWLGAVVAFLVLALAAITSADVQTLSAAYLSMAVMARFTLVPLSFASLLTGLILSLRTKWGLLQHYWVVMKLVINVVASVLLLMYLQTLNFFAGIAAQTSWSNSDLVLLQSPSPLLHSGAAALLLLIATILSVYKPQGLTHYGWRKQQQRRSTPRPVEVES
jgi:hypothetical protein